MIGQLCFQCAGRRNCNAHFSLSLSLSLSAGIAIVAHLFSVPSATTPTAASASTSPEVGRHATVSNPGLARVVSGLLTGPASPFDDPFASQTASKQSGADMCLGLEMMRNGTLNVIGQTRVIKPSEARSSSSGQSSTARRPGLARKSSASTKDKLLANVKGKQKQSTAGNDVELDQVQVETPTDVRVYVDPRCPDTAIWFEDMFCRQGRQDIGIKVDVGGESFQQAMSFHKIDLDSRTQQAKKSSSLRRFQMHPQLRLRRYKRCSVHLSHFCSDAHSNLLRRLDHHGLMIHCLEVSLCIVTCRQESHGLE